MASHQPLEGIRVLELGGYLSGPYAGSLLSALGADVVKVERPNVGDAFRRDDDNRNLYFMQFNAGKRSLAVDLKRPEGQALVKDLIPHFDVVVDNMRPGKLAALGLDAATCLALNPDVIAASVTGFGESGPLSERPAYDTIGQAHGGLYSILGDAGDPQLSGGIFADLVSGLVSAMGILASLVGRRNGGGHSVQTSLLEAVSTLTIDAFTQYFDDGRVNPTRQSRHPHAQNFCLRTSSGEYIAVHLSSSQAFWRGLAEAIGSPELVDDPRFLTYYERLDNYAELVRLVEARFLERPLADWLDILARHDVPFAAVNDMEAWARDPQVAWLELLEPEEKGLSLVRPPWRFDGQRPHRETHAPRVGEHTLEIASEVRDPTAIDALIDRGVISTPAADETETGTRRKRGR